MKPKLKKNVYQSKNINNNINNNNNYSVFYD